MTFSTQFLYQLQWRWRDHLHVFSTARSLALNSARLIDTRSNFLSRVNCSSKYASKQNKIARYARRNTRVVKENRRSENFKSLVKIRESEENRRSENFKSLVKIRESKENRQCLKFFLWKRWLHSTFTMRIVSQREWS